MRIWYDELQNCMNTQFCLDQAESLNEQMCALPKYALMQMLSIDKFINRKTDKLQNCAYAQVCNLHLYLWTLNVNANEQAECKLQKYAILLRPKSDWIGAGMTLSQTV